jgi:hypothetical protein
MLEAKEASGTRFFAIGIFHRPDFGWERLGPPGQTLSFYTCTCGCLDLVQDAGGSWRRRREGGD